MTSRERVRAVLNHQVPDQMPNGLGGCETAGMHVKAYKNLQKVLNLPDDPPRLDTFMCNAVFEENALQAMGGDIMLVASPNMCKAPIRGPENEELWKIQELWGEKFRIPKVDTLTTKEDGSVVWETFLNWVCPKGAYFFDTPTRSDLLADFPVPDPEKFNPPMHLPENKLRELEKLCKYLYEETDYALCMGETITDLQMEFRLPGGIVGNMILMKEEPDIVRECIDKSVDSALSQLEELDQAVGKYCEMLSIAQDFGDSRGILLGEDLWREMYKPAYKKLFRNWQKITPMKVNLHSCGSIWRILDDLVECGVQVYNPVQICANGMDPKFLKEKWGKDIVFWGAGYDSQSFRPECTYEEVYQKIRDVLLAFKPGGGYIFAGVHNLPPNMPESHVKAMLDAFNDVKKY